MRAKELSLTPEIEFLLKRDYDLISTPVLPLADGPKTAEDRSQTYASYGLRYFCGITWGQLMSELIRWPVNTGTHHSDLQGNTNVSGLTSIISLKPSQEECLPGRPFENLKGRLEELQNTVVRKSTSRNPTDSFHFRALHEIEDWKLFKEFCVSGLCSVGPYGLAVEDTYVVFSAETKKRSHDEYVARAVDKYLMSTPGPKVRVRGSSWMLPDLSYRPGREQTEQQKK